MYVVVDYEVDGVAYSNELHQMTDPTQPITLLNAGKTQAMNVRLFQSDATGTSRAAEFTFGSDFTTYHLDDGLGNLANQITAQVFTNRRKVGHVSDQYDAAVVTGTAVVSAFDELIRGINADAAVVIGNAVISATEVYNVHGSVDANAGTVVGQAVVSASDTYHGLDPILQAPSLGQGGVLVRYGSALGGDSLDTVSPHNSFPEAPAIGVWVRWSTLNPSPGVYTWPAALDRSIEDAIAKGYQITLRVACGNTCPSWIFTDATHPVTKVNTFSTDQQLVPVTLALMWDQNLWYHYQNLCTWIASQLDPSASSGLTVANPGAGVNGGFRRVDTIYMFPVAMATELGTEMTLGYGSGSAYSPATGAATLASVTGGTGLADTRQPSAGGPTAFNLTGSLTGYPSGMWAWKVGQEIVLATRSGSTLTIHNTRGRGWSGGTAVPHTAGEAVTYISGYYYVADGTESQLYGINGAVYDAHAWNVAAWLANGTLTQNRANYNGANQSPPSAWDKSIDIVVQTISKPLGIPASVAYGGAWADNYAGAVALATQKAGQYPVELVGMTTNYEPGKSAAGDPTRNGQASYYEGWSVYPARALRAHAAAGGAIGTQTAATSVYTGFNNPWFRDQANCAILATHEEMFTVFTNFRFWEGSPDFINKNKGDANPLHDNYYYLIGSNNPNNISKRLQGITVTNPLGALVVGKAVIGAVESYNASVGLTVDFETGNLAQFSSVTNGGTIISAFQGNAALGNWSMRMLPNGAAAYGKLTIPAGNDRVAMRFYLDTEVLPDSLLQIAEFIAPSNVTVRLSATGDISMQIAGGTAVTAYTIPSAHINTNEFYRIELIADFTTTTGALWMRVYDALGNQVTDSTNAHWDAVVGAVKMTTTVVAGNITEGRFGVANATPLVGELYMDQITVAWGATQGFIGA